MSMILLRDLPHALLDMVFPQRCVSCGVSGAPLCAACAARVRAPASPRCMRCGRSLSSDTPTLPYAEPSVATFATDPARCPICAHAPASPLTAVRVVADYEGAIRAVLLAFKFRGQRRLAAPLGDLLAAELARWGAAPDVVVAVPLHARRRRERGYNQADLLARRCSARLGVPYLREALRWRREARLQVGLTLGERRENVRDAFALAPAFTTRLAGKGVLIVDDVTTTGSTLEAVAAALQSAQPAAIFGLAVARPPLHDDLAPPRPVHSHPHPHHAPSSMQSMHTRTGSDVRR